MVSTTNKSENKETETSTNPNLVRAGSNADPKKKILILVGILLLCALSLALFIILKNNHSQSTRFAQTAVAVASPLPAASTPSFPQPNMTLKLNTLNKDNKTVSGTFTLTNTSSVGASDLHYGITLRSPQKIVQLDRGGKKINAAHQDLISYIDSPQGFQIGPGRSLTFPFQISYNPHISPGTYTVQVTVVSNLGIPISTSAETVNLTGRDDILTLTPGSCKITINNQDYTPNSAYPVDRNSSNQGVCTFTNNTNNTETFGYNMTYAVQHVLNYPASEKLNFADQKTVTFKPGETKVIPFTLPTNLDPQVYEGYVSLTDSQNQPQSPLVPFRWTIKGQSGKIESIKLDKDFYPQNSLAQVTTTIDPSMDLYWRSQDMSLGTELNNSKAEVTLSSGNQVCGSKTYLLPNNFLTPASFVFSIPVNRDCPNPTVKINFLSNNVNLASASYGVLTVSASQVSNSNSKLSEIIFGVILAAIALFVIILLLKNGKKKAPMIMIILLLLAVGAIFFRQPTPIHAGGTGGTAVPAPGPIYVSTDGNCSGCHWGTVTFNGTEDQNGNVTISGTNWNQMGCSNYEITADISGPGISGWIDGLGPNTSWSYTINNVKANATYYVSAESNQYDHCGCSCGGVGSWSNNNGFPNQYGVINVKYCPCSSNSANYCTNQTVPDACGNPVCGSGTEQPACVSGSPVCGGSCSPPLPTGISANAVCNNGLPQVNISWSAPSGATSYNITRSDSVTVENNYGLTSITDGSPNRATNYSYTVQACNSNGCSSGATSNTVTTGWCDRTPPKTSISAFPPPGKTCMTQTDLQNDPAQITSTDFGDGSGGTNPSGLNTIQLNVYEVIAGGIIDRNSPLNSTTPVTVTGNTNTSNLYVPYSKMVSGHQYAIVSYAVDQAGNSNLTTAPVSTTFDFDQSSCVTPFLKTNNGDVHSNGSIYAPGGPQ